MKKTMVGMAPRLAVPPPAEPPPAEDPRPAITQKRTVVGMPAAPPRGSRPPQITIGPSRSSAPPRATPATQSGDRSEPGFGQKTVIGIPSPLPEPPPPIAEARGHEDRSRAPFQPAKKTVLGVAMPGIAPLAPGVPKPSPPPSPYPPHRSDFPSEMEASGPPIGMPPSEPWEEPPRPARSPSRPRARRSERSATLAIASGLVLAAGAAAFALLWRSPAPLRAEAHVDANGIDMLHLTCATCPDDTELRIGHVRAKIKDRVADISLPAPLDIGENRFKVELDRPDTGRDENVSLVVKIGYRIRPDLSTLEAERPLLRIAVEGVPLSTMTIDGKQLELGRDGKAQYDIDVSSDCTGFADETKTIERAIPYGVVSSSGVNEQGVVNVRVGVVPLRLDLPLARAVIEGDRFPLAGRTGKNARLSVGEQLIGVGADGSFSRSVVAPLIGENAIALRASVPGQAPRSATLRVRRVERLADEAKAFSATAPLAFTELAADVQKHVGEPVVLTGEVVEARAQGGSKYVALLDVQKGCSRPPCLARVVLSAETGPARGDPLQVFGHVSRAIAESPGVQGAPKGTVPEVEAAFILKKR